MNPLLALGAIAIAGAGVHHSLAPQDAPMAPRRHVENRLRNPAEPSQMPRISSDNPCVRGEDTARWRAHVFQPVFGDTTTEYQPYQLVSASAFEVRFDPWTGERLTDPESKEFVSNLVYDSEKRAIRLIGLYDPRNGLPVNRKCRY